MATTGFWPIKGSLKDLIKYADNPDKTTNPKHLDDDLAKALKYVENDDKTDMKMFVTGINCITVRAYEEMMATKHHFGKTGGNVAYHGYQSFKIDEVTPEEAHKIGLETARRMWGKEYQMIVTTHLNTENIHNHIVVNSVSYKTGLKFENHISDHIRLREISDSVCREFNKSVLENAKFYKSNKKFYWMEKNDKVIHRSVLKQDVDDAIKESGNLMEFDRIMHLKGYTFHRPIGTSHPSVITEGWEKPIRIDSLGDDYTTDRIKERISQNGIKAPIRGVSDGVIRTRQKYKQTPLDKIERQLNKVKYMDMIELLFYVITELLKPSQPTTTYKPPLTPILRQELRKFNQYQKQFRLLHDENIHTVPELEAFIGKLSKQLDDLDAERKKTDNKRRRAKTDDETKEYYAQIRGISAQMKPIREKLKLAKATLEAVPKVNELLDIERKKEQKIINKERGISR